MTLVRYGPPTGRDRFRAALDLAILVLAALVGVVALPTSVLLLFFVFLVPSEPSDSGNLELLAWPSHGWDILWYGIGWLVVLCVVAFVIGVAVAYARRCLEVLADRPPLDTGLRRLFRVYRGIVSEFSDER